MLPALALATLALAAVGALAARRLRGLVAYLVVASAGTLLLAIGLATRETVAVDTRARRATSAIVGSLDRGRPACGGTSALLAP